MNTRFYNLLLICLS